MIDPKKWEETRVFYQSLPVEQQNEFSKAFGEILEEEIRKEILKELFLERMKDTI